MCSDVAGKLHHFIQAAFGIEYRVVGSLQKNRVAIFIDPFETSGMVFTAIKRLPKGFVLGGLGFAAAAEHAVVLAYDLLQRIMHSVEKVLIGIDNPAIRRKLDHGHGTAQGIHDALVFVLFIDPVGDVGRHFHHTEHLPAGVGDRHVAGL